MSSGFRLPGLEVGLHFGSRVCGSLLYGRLGSEWGKAVTTAEFLYNIINFIKNPHNRFPIARPLGQTMLGVFFVSSKSELFYICH